MGDYAKDDRAGRSDIHNPFTMRLARLSYN